MASPHDYNLRCYATSYNTVIQACLEPKYKLLPG